MRQFTLKELSNYDGQNGRPAYIAYAGKVYDVSKSWYWQNGTHQALHIAGQDLTNLLAKAPHGADLLERVPLIGFIID